MKPAPDASDRLVRVATWLFVGPRLAVGVLLLAILGLAGFLMFAQIALVVLRRLGG